MAPRGPSSARPRSSRSSARPSPARRRSSSSARCTPTSSSWTSTWAASTGSRRPARSAPPTPTTMVVLVSTYAASDLAADARTCGAAAYVHKEELAPRVLRELWSSGGDAEWRQPADPRRLSGPAERLRIALADAESLRIGLPTLTLSTCGQPMRKRSAGLFSRGGRRLGGGCRRRRRARPRACRRWCRRSRR